ncbi:hypothetical protein SLA2020_064930 [Shorea laevis]
MANFSVIRSKRSLVTPVEETPSGILDLSVIDKILILRSYAGTLHVYKHGGAEAAASIREALSKALVPYYPLAGRLKHSDQGGDVHLECTGEGAWFVEASTDSTLDTVNYFDNVLSIPHDELLPDQVPEENEPLVQMQVTKFACGGFVIGLRFCHTVCDGLGSAQFMNAIGEPARTETLSISPVWQRDFFPAPNQESKVAAFLNLPPPMPNYQLEHANVDISMDEINQLKKEFFEKAGQTCSAFEAVAASFWSLRTKAINFDPNTEMRLVFFAYCRQLLDPPLPQGFYGNCFFPVTITANGDYLRSGEDPFAQPLIYSTLFISEWGRLGFNQVDCGCGPPVHVVPIQGSSIIPVGIVGSLPLPKKGIRLMTWCVEAVHRKPFLDLMAKSV